MIQEFGLGPRSDVLQCQDSRQLFYVRWTPHPVIVTIMDNRDYIRVLLYSYYTTITGWGGPPKFYASEQRRELSKFLFSS